MKETCNGSRASDADLEVPSEARDFTRQQKPESHAGFILMVFSTAGPLDEDDHLNLL